MAFPGVQKRPKGKDIAATKQKNSEIMCRKISLKSNILIEQGVGGRGHWHIERAADMFPLEVCTFLRQRNALPTSIHTPQEATTTPPIQNYDFAWITLKTFIFHIYFRVSFMNVFNIFVFSFCQVGCSTNPLDGN